MACKLQIRGRDIDQATLRAILQQFASDPTFKNIIMFDNYMRMTKDEAEVTGDVIDFISQQFNMPNKDVVKGIQAEHARRVKEGIIQDKDNMRNMIAFGAAKEKLTALKNWVKNVTSNKGIFRFFGKEGNKAFERRKREEGEMNKWALETERKMNAMNNIFAEYDKFLTPEDRIAIGKILNGKAKLESIPLINLQGDENAKKREALLKKLGPVLADVRNHIDQGTRLLAKTPSLLNKYQIQIYTDNEGKYTTLVYEAHRDPNWAAGFENMGKKGYEPYKAIFDQAQDQLKGFFRGEVKKLNKKRAKRVKAIQTLQAKGQLDAADISAIEKFQKDIKNIDNDIKRLEDAIQYPEKMQIEVVNMLKNMYKGASVTNLFTPSGKRGAVSKAIFKKRKQIPQEIKALFGEITDPVELYAATMSRILAVTTNADLQNNLADLNERLFKEYNKNKNNYQGIPPLFSITPMPELGMTEEITLPDSFSVLSDRVGGTRVYATPEFKEAFEAMEPPKVGAFRSFTSMINSWAKANATIFNIETQFRNTESNFVKIITELLFSPYKKQILNQLRWTIQERAKMEAKDLMNIRNGKKSSYSNEYEQFENVLTQQGVKGAAPELKSLQLSVKNSSTALNAIESLFSGPIDRFVSKIPLIGEPLSEGFSKAYNSLKSTSELLQRLYAGGDDVFKEALFVKELYEASNVYYGKDYDKLVKEGTPDQIKAIQDRAGEIIRRTMPNYAESYAISKWLQNSTAGLYIAPFLSFRLEQIRTTAETFRVIGEQIKNNEQDPKVRRKLKVAGYRRLLSFSTLIAASTSYFANIFLNSLDDEEEEFYKKWWVDDHIENPLIEQTADGFIEIVDMSSFNIYGSVGIADAALKSMAADPSKSGEIFGNAFIKFLSPALSPQIATGAIIQAYMGKDSFGRDLYTPLDSPIERFQKGLEYYFKQVFVPGTIKSAGKIEKKEDDFYDQLNQLDVMKAEYNNDPSEKNLRRVEMQERVVDRLELETEYEKKVKYGSTEGRLPGIRTYVKDPEVQLPNKIYKLITANDEIQQTFATEVKATEDKTTEKVSELYDKLYNDYIDNLDQIREYYEEAMSMGYDLTKLFQMGTLGGEGTARKLRKGMFSKKELAYIFGESNIPPDPAISGYETEMKIEETQEGQEEE